MNNTIKLAVASALLAAASSASAAGGIVAGDWTLDIGGIVNAYYTTTKYKGSDAGTGPLGQQSGESSKVNNITTGLLPNYLSVSGKTRQNDLDVGFTISINPGASTASGGGQGAFQENRQAFLTFGDASWGSVKLGKDLGIYASDAILSDMTLLGVGSGAGHINNTTTLGRIGTGYMYADWKSQVAYSSPNFNGFNFTAGVTQAWNAVSYADLLAAGAANGVGLTALNSATSTDRGGNAPAFEAKAAYAFSADAVNGKVWVSGLSQKVKGLAGTGENADTSSTANAWDVGANANFAGFGATAYYGEGKGIGQTIQFSDGFDSDNQKRKSTQYYVQGTYTLPGVGTKLGASYGESKLEGNTADNFGNLKDNMLVVGAYHPLTKHLTLVAEYSDTERKVSNVSGYDASEDSDASSKASAQTVSLGAILFF
jgi:predicted porin